MKRSIAILSLIFLCLSCVSNGNAAEPRKLDKASANKKSQTTRAISKKIDSLVAAKLADLGQKRNPEIDDETFVRRIYLDVVGRIPTISETRSFLNSDSKNKRAQLIDKLLNSYGHVSRQFNFWADVLRVRSKINGVTGDHYINFIKDSLEKNQPYDEFVRELLESEGDMIDPKDGAIGYYLRDMNMPEDNMSNTVRVFLGTRLECAQCHDHPFDVWTQRDYFEMVAFTGGMKYKKDGAYNGFKKSDREKISKAQKNYPKGIPKVKNILKSMNTGVYGSGTGLAKLPEGFMGSDGDEGEVVTGLTMFDRQPLVDAKIPQIKSGKKKQFKKRKGNRIPGAVDLGSREAYADWMTSPDNPRFATTIANRLWKQAMGVGLIEPVDVIDDSTRASNEQLMDYLTDVMVDLDFDRKAFLRVVYNSQTYQAQASSDDIKDVTTYGFNGPVLRRMSAEQLWDSLLCLAVPEIDKRSTVSFGSPKVRQEIVKTFAKKDHIAADDVINAAKRLSKGYGEEKREIESRKREARKEMKEKVRVLAKEIQVAKRNGKKRLANDLMLKRAKMVSSSKSKDKKSKLKRASELQSPAPAGHFLREFGQSDRDQIENANTEPAVTQVLSMMNGMIDKTIAKDQNSVLMTNVLKASSEDVVKVVFLTMLSRKPTAEEVKVWAADFKADRKAAYTDLIWTIANSNEFIFVK